jgi:two-component system, chemotaxis family, protein-glutamate methylesterase/glutaminase
MAASAGGTKALSTVLGALPASLHVPILVVQHLDPRHETLLAGVLGRRTPLEVKLAEDGELAQGGWVYLVPPDHHVLAGADGTLTLSMAEKMHFLRPSADLLFESVASTYGDRALVVVLSGSGSDGAVGVRAVDAQGGTVIVQDLVSAEFNGMPRAAAETGVADFVLPLDEIGPVVYRLTSSGETA